MLTECAHCRAALDRKHSADCALAKKRGLEREDPPKAILYVGAVVQYFDAPLSRKTFLAADAAAVPRAAICTRAADGDKTPAVLRVLGADGADEDVVGPDDSRWRWPVR